MNGFSSPKMLMFWIKINEMLVWSCLHIPLSVCMFIQLEPSEILMFLRPCVQCCSISNSKYMFRVPVTRIEAFWILERAAFEIKKNEYKVFDQHPAGHSDLAQHWNIPPHLPLYGKFDIFTVPELMQKISLQNHLPFSGHQHPTRGHAVYLIAAE